MNVSSLKKLSANLRRLPKVLAAKVTESVAPKITVLGESTFRAGTDPYGTPWRPGADGKAVTLVKTGALSRFLRYVAIGSKLRVSIGVRYAKYQIGRRPVFPRQGATLPKSYVAALTASTNEAINSELGGGS